MAREQRICLLSLLGLVAAMLLAPGAAWSWPDYPTAEAYTRFLTNDPWDEEPAWAGDVTQGISHDDAHWYISQKQRLWAIHRSVDLGAVQGDAWPLVYSTRASQFPIVAGYEHYSDIDFADLAKLRPGAGDARRFVVMALEDVDRTRCGALALFTGYDPANPGASLVPVAKSCIPYNGAKAPWAAVSPDGFVYAGRDDDVGRLSRLRVDWSADFAATGCVPISCEVEPADPQNATVCGSGIDLADGSGNPISLDGVQGVAFSESGRVVYVSTRYDGLYVFRADDGRLLERSCQASNCRFRFEFSDLGGTVGLEEEPEGLTVWDLEEATDLGGETRGSLHVLLVDKTAFQGEKVYLKHYTGRVYVGSGGSGGDGRFVADRAAPDGGPFGSFADAIGYAWAGARVVFLGGGTGHPGSYSVDRFMRLESRGPVSIGE
jgi:hypothetical protein